MRILCFILSVHLSSIFCFGQLSSYPTYRQRILNIQQTVAQWVSHDDFFGDTNFIALYEHPTDCSSNALLFIKSAENPDDSKLIVVYSLQRLPLDRYVVFEKNLIDMAESRQISSNLLNRAIFPGLEWSTKIQKNFSNPDVKALVQKIKKCLQINSGNREYLKEITSGKACEDVRDLEEAGMLPAHAAQN